MAIDTRQKRMAAINPGCPWRGAMVDAAVAGFDALARAAAAYLAAAGRSPFASEPGPEATLHNLRGRTSVLINIAGRATVLVGP